MGALFTMGDHASLADVMIEELSDKERLAKKGDNGRKRVLEKFTFRQSCKRFESIYHSAINANITDQS